MLKHRYSNISESVTDFNRMLDGMNKTQPLERSFDEDLLDMFQVDQELVRLEQQIEHLHRAVFGSGMAISESEVDALKKAHAHAAATYQAAADKARAKIKQMSDTHDQERLAKMQALHARFRKMAQEHADKAQAVPVAESVQRPAMVSRFRVLAGIDVDVQMPRDPGVFGTTRFNDGYQQMAQPFTEAKDETAAHDKRMKADAKKIKAAADDVEREHEDEKSKEESKWAGDAVKHPGKLHKYFGVPEGQKIPMSKIKGAYDKLKDKKDKSSEETSLMRALALGVRFKGGDVPGGEKKKGLAGD